jgi:hypothetical protein
MRSSGIVEYERKTRMQTSPRLGLAYIQPQQAQKHVTANETFRRLDALVQLSVKSSSTAAEPAAPGEGDAYILPAGFSGAAWSGFTQGSVAAFQDGAWAEIAPRKGWRAYAEDSGQFVVFDGALWRNEAALGAEATFSKLTVRRSSLLQNNFVVDGSYQALSFYTYSGTNWHQPYLQACKARGSEAAPQAAQNGDAVFSFDMYAHDGASFVRMGTFGYSVGGAVSTGVVPGAASIRLNDAGGVLRQILTISATKLTVDGAVRVKSHAKANLPSASGEGAGAILYVSDEAGGPVLAFSDGTNWRRVTDRAVVS